jgi:geranylgeranyl pyrophosphate synthase
MGDLFSSTPSSISVCAASIEMVHAASLSHDDVIDEATMRRGEPSINHVAGNKKAVLAGDYLLAGVIARLTDLGNLRLVKEMSCVIQDLAQGEWLQLDLINSRAYSREVISQVALYKTGSVMSWCCVSSVITSSLVQDANKEKLIKLSKDFGEHLGHAFQLWDDTLDFSELSEKDQNLDLDNGLVNAVVYEWLTLNVDLFKRFKEGEELSSLMNNAPSLDEALAKIKKEASHHLNQCRELLKSMLTLIPSDGGELERKAIPIYDILDYLEQRAH